MASQEQGTWVTINGRHVLIQEGESATDAINRSIAEHNADLKEKQIAQNKEQADRLNGKDNDVTYDIEVPSTDNTHKKENKHNTELVQKSINSILQESKIDNPDDLEDYVWTKIYDIHPFALPDDQSVLVLDNNKGKFDKDAQIGLVKVSLHSPNNKRLSVKLEPSYTYMDDFDDDVLEMMGIEKRK